MSANPSPSSTFPKSFTRTDATVGTDVDPTSLAAGAVSAQYAALDNVWSAAAAATDAGAETGYGPNRKTPKQFVIVGSNTASGATTWKVKVCVYDPGAKSWYTAAAQSASKAYGLVVPLAVPILEGGIYAFVVTSDDVSPPAGTYTFSLGYDWAAA